MKTINILIAPDFAPEHFAGWYILNTYLQKNSGLQSHLIAPASAKEQFAQIGTGEVDIIYANPFDAAYLVRELGYKAVAKPINKSDEMVIATGADSSIRSLSHLKKGNSIAITANKDVKLIGLRLLEAVDLAEEDLEWIETENYQSAARKAINGEADAAFFLAESYHSFGKLTKARLHTLIESAMDDIFHVLLSKPDTPEVTKVADSFIELTQEKSKRWVMAELGIPSGFTKMAHEETEFMIDIIDTLLD